MAKKLVHVIVTSYPAQGHVIPLMKFAYKVAEHGLKVTFVNTEFLHAKIMAAMPDKVDERNQISFVSIPDGLESDHDRNDPFKQMESIFKVMPGHLESLIQKLNLQAGDDQQITCVIADSAAWWALEVAKKLGIKRAAFLTAGLGNMALVLHIPMLIEAGVIDVNGMPMVDELIILSKEIPAWNPQQLTWSCPGQPELQKFIFQHFTCKAILSLKICDWLLTNSFYELEQSAHHLVPLILPVGPFENSTHLSHCPGNFWPEDPTCLSWLDKQTIGSVIYVAFGSITVFSQQQFSELALGLEHLGQPVLWIVRSNAMNGTKPEFPDRFIEKIADRGKIVEWASQETVLSHPSIACFFSHCGWNSTMEGLSRGIPFLCWPYFADQFHNRSYICEAWKIGLNVNPNENGIITRHEIEKKSKSLLSDDSIKANALKMKEMARKSIAAGGSSFKNFQVFIEEMKN